MDKKFGDFVSSLKYDEVLDIKQDLSSGATRVKKIINQKIKDFENNHRKLCSVCFNQINPNHTSTYTLVFGPADFKKKATFCALDCLNYFLQHLEQSISTTPHTKKPV